MRRIATCEGCACELRWSEWPYSDRFDAIACLTCDRWLEDACDDAACRFCPGRPSKPSECEVKPTPVRGRVTL